MVLNVGDFTTRKGLNVFLIDIQSAAADWEQIFLVDPGFHPELFRFNPLRWLSASLGRVREIVMNQNFVHFVVQPFRENASGCQPKSLFLKPFYNYVHTAKIQSFRD